MNSLIFPIPLNPGVFLISNVVAFKRLFFFLFDGISLSSRMYFVYVFRTMDFFFPYYLLAVGFSLQFWFCFVSDF